MVSDALTIGPDPGELQIHLMRAESAILPLNNTD